MALMPKRTKFRRHMRGTVKGSSSRGSFVSFGKYGLKALEKCYLSVAQIESARKSITNHTKRGGKLWIRAFADKPMTKKPNETRMGGGKGLVSHYASVVRPGKILFELDGVTKQIAREAFAKAASKLPIKAKFVSEE